MLFRMVATVILEFGDIIKLCLFHGLKPWGKKEGRDKKRREKRTLLWAYPLALILTTRRPLLVLRMCLLQNIPDSCRRVWAASKTNLRQLLLLFGSDETKWLKPLFLSKIKRLNILVKVKLLTSHREKLSDVDQISHPALQLIPFLLPSPCTFL